MKYLLYILLIVTFLFAGTPLVRADGQDSESKSREYQIKAGYLYNFFGFVEWPEQKSLQSVESVTIGIVCLYPHKDYRKIFGRLSQKTINDNPIKVVFFDDLTPVINPSEDTESERTSIIESMKKCHMLNICGDSYTDIDKTSVIFELLNGCGVLTVGESQGFIEKGGNINFISEGNKIRFEVNLDSTKNNNLSIRAKLLKLAKRVISKNSEGGKR